MCNRADVCLVDPRLDPPWCHFPTFSYFFRHFFLLFVRFWVPFFFFQIFRTFLVSFSCYLLNFVRFFCVWRVAFLFGFASFYLSIMCLFFVVQYSAVTVVLFVVIFLVKYGVHIGDLGYRNFEKLSFLINMKY